MTLSVISCPRGISSLANVEEKLCISVTARPLFDREGSSRGRLWTGKIDASENGSPGTRGQWFSWFHEGGYREQGLFQLSCKSNC